MCYHRGNECKREGTCILHVGEGFPNDKVRGMVPVVMFTFLVVLSRDLSP